jgi:AcrR family transcriptional regulator
MLRATHQEEMAMSTPVRAQSTRALQAEQTRAQIVETAQRLFAEHGYDATSLQMIADELGLTKAAVYYHFPAKTDIMHESMQPGIRRMQAVVDEVAALRGRRARIEHLVDGFVDFLVSNRTLAVAMANDPAAKRNKMDDEAVELQCRSIELLYGEHPTPAERLAFYAVTYIPECLPELVDLSDDELRAALTSTLLRLLRGPS